MTAPRLRLPLLCLLPLSPCALLSQQPAEKLAATMTFHFERSGLAVPAYTFTLHADGTATYVATYTDPPSAESKRYGSNASVTAPVPAGETTRSVALTPQTTARLFTSVRSVTTSHKQCESSTRGIADTGAKTITYAGPEGPFACTFNYTESKPAQSIYETVSAIAYTIDEGRALDFKHRFDRLGLDQEIGFLVEAIHDGRATELGTIAPVLESIAEDSQVLERVRKRATGLLELARNTR